METSTCLSAIQASFPHLSIDSVSPLGEGWANWSFEPPDGLVFRFPKSMESAAELEAIKPIILELGAHLALPTPSYELQGDWRGVPFVGYPKIPGNPLEATRLEQHPHPQELCAQLGAFLTELHSFPLTRLRQEFPDAVESPWLTECVELASQCREGVLPFLPSKLSNRIQSEFDQFLAALEANPIEAVFIHGDLEPAHILLDDATNQISGIIDFDDGGIGAPAWDMRLLLYYYGAPRLKEILTHYSACPVDDFFWRRVEFYNRVGYFQDALNAQSANNDAWLDKCLYAITAAFR